MLYFLALIAGVLAGYVLARMSTRPRTAESAAQPQPSPDAKTETPAPKPKTVGESIRDMAAAVESAGNDSAHPHDLGENKAFRQAVELFAAAATPLPLVISYATGVQWPMAAAALAGLYERADGEQAIDAVLAHFPHLGSWPLYFALRLIGKRQPGPAVGSLVVRVPDWWSEHAVVPRLLVDYFAERAARQEPVSFGGALDSLTADELETTEKLLKSIAHPVAEQLLEQLEEWRKQTLNRPFLQSFGRFWEADVEQQLLVEYPMIADGLSIAEASIQHSPPRSILVVAEARTGKTAFLKLVAQRLAPRGWTVFEAGAGSLVSGAVYIGQLEERLRQLTAELSIGKRALWYVPDFLQLAKSGTHRGQAASILDQVFGAIASGKIIVLSEITADGLTKLLQAKPALRGAIDILRLKPLDERQVDDLARAVARKIQTSLGVEVSEALLESATHLTRHCFGAAQMPGMLLDVLKLAVQNAAANGEFELEKKHLLHTLSQLTGMPHSILDDRERIDLAAIRRFFAARVIGQEEAVNTVVDRIAMLKAGLADPSRPVGVFLFAGPTGTGKTELAKTLAAFLFGSAERLVRLDMSEFQTYDSTRKIIGEAGEHVESESLTQRIRKQPFAIVLLDEFEKAHSNVWDLFLQVFDDGRLTDANGHTADFRHTIIVLTSNLGATAHQDSGVGFAPQSTAFSRAQIVRAVEKNFRPEFVNRLDKVVVFRPLTRDLMRGILAKELALVLTRRGLQHRDWAVEWEASALEFLLDHGFTLTLGARPLKRAIDQHLLAPLAATIVEHRFPTGEQFLFVRSDGKSIQVEFVDPDAPAAAAPVEAVAAPMPASEPVTLARMILHASGNRQEQATLAEVLRAIETQLAGKDWNDARAAYLAEIHSGDFWDRADRHTVLAQYSLMDRVGAAAATARALAARLERSANGRGTYSRDLIGRLALQLLLLQHGIEDARSRSPVEVALMVSPSLETAIDAESSRQWCETVLGMYRNWARVRHMQLSESTEGAWPVLIVTGFGAARTLLAEQGLHILESANENESSRVVARVKAIAVPNDLSDAHRKQGSIATALERAPALATVVRRYRLGPAPLIRDARKSWRTGRAALVMEGQFDLMEEIAGD